MKKLVLPFVVIALFAIGSCGDDAVQPTVKNSVDTTAKRDTADTPIAIKLKELKGIYVSVPAIMVHTEGKYVGTGAGGSYEVTKQDTNRISCGSVDFKPYFNGKPGNVYVSYHDSVNNSYVFTWYNYTAGPLLLDSLSFTVDTVKKELTDIMYKSYNNNTNGGGNSESYSFYIKLKKAQYQIKNNTLSIQFQTGLHDVMEKFSYSQGASYYRSSFYSNYTIGLDPNNKGGSFNIQIALE